MKIPFIVALLCGLAVTGLQASPAQPARRDYAVFFAGAYPQEIALGQKRLARALRHLNSGQRELLAQRGLVAVQVNEVDASEVPYMLHRLFLGRVASSQYYHDTHAASSVQLKFLIFLNGKTEQPVGDVGVLVTDTPQLNHLARFGDKEALYVGTGW